MSNTNNNNILSIKQRFGIIGNSELLNRALEIALRVAPTDLSVLVTGESGVGKEYIPKIIHDNTARKHGKYVAVNCGAIPEGTIDSELFGHEKGAFTGAVDSRKGYFEEADGGTIFLDEVGELPLSTQVRLLRVLQTGEFIRVGSAKVQKTNVRVVAATNNNLQRAISEGKFREDLYYRLNTVPIAVPALRERPDDIYLLFRKFASDVAVQYRMPAIVLEPAAREMIEHYPWPGNIRQLKNVAEQISAIEQSREISAQILSTYLVEQRGATAPSVAGASSFDDMNTERELLYKVLFDMRNDINEMKMMLRQLQGYGVGVTPPMSPEPKHKELAGLLPQHPHNTPNTRHETEYDYAEEVIEEQQAVPATKADMQREQIMRALRRNGGSRRAAAAELFMSERTLYRRIKELGIEE